MSGSKDQPSTNLLFSPANDLFNVGNSSAFLVPVQSPSTSALMTSENISAEEDSFLGQNDSQQPATFSLFTGAVGNDPFSGVGTADPASNGFMTSEQEPQLYVPPSTSASPVPPPASSFTSVTGYSTPPSVTLNAQDGHTLMSNSGPPPPPSQTYMNAQDVRTSPYANARYVPPPSYSATSTISTPIYNQGQVAPPPVGGFTPTSSFAPPMPTNQSNPAPSSFTKLASSMPPPPTAQSMYHSVPSHWCYSKKLSDGAVAWYPFSYYDSQRLEEAVTYNHDGVVSTEGGRYDVSVAVRERTSVYWEEPTAMVRRCTWFAKGDNDHRYSPFEEDVAQNLEEEYKKVVFSNNWHKQVDLDGGEMIVIHNPQVIVHLAPMEDKDHFGSLPEHAMRSRIVKRGIHEIELGKEIPENEIGSPDHIVFVCHGIGPVCDLRSRSIVECVDDFRTIHLSLLKSHFKNALEAKRAHRIEFLPVHWHRALHGDACGVDRDIRRLTLPSIQRLRQFTNETLLDILFYSSPIYCQTIADTIGSEINSLHHLFLSRNPGYTGKVSIAGHSLGSLMVFDLLCNQGLNSNTLNETKPTAAVPEPDLVAPVVAGRVPAPYSAQEELQQIEETKVTLEELLGRLNLNNFKPKFDEEQMDMDTLMLCSEGDLKDIGLPMGPRKKLIGYLKQQQQEEEKKRAQREAEADRLKAESILREQAAKGEAAAESSADQRLESVTSFMSGAMNVHVDFQQYDSGTGQPMVKYPQLQFEPEIFFALGSPIGMFLTVRGVSDLGEEFCLPTCGRFFNVFHPYDPVAYRIEPLINPEIAWKPVQVPHYKGRKRLHLELRDSLGRMGSELKQGIINSVRKAIGSMQRFAQNHWQTGQTETEVEEEVKKVTDELLKEQSEKSHDSDDIVSVASESSQAQAGYGKINQGQRIDYVLQERPLESFNDYLFAFQSHLCYWNSEDTVLLMMKEIYKGMDVLSDSQIQRLQQSQSSIPPPPSQQITGTPPPPLVTSFTN